MYPTKISRDKGGEKKKLGKKLSQKFFRKKILAQNLAPKDADLFYNVFIPKSVPKTEGFAVLVPTKMLPKSGIFTKMTENTLLPSGARTKRARHIYQSAEKSPNRVLVFVHTLKGT